MKTITVLYSCKGCGAKDEKVEVEARLEPDLEPVLEWMEKVKIAISKQHRRNHISCRATTTEVVKLPMGNVDDPNNWIGKPVEEEK